MQRAEAFPLRVGIRVARQRGNDLRLRAVERLRRKHAALHRAAEQLRKPLHGIPSLLRHIDARHFQRVQCKPVRRLLRSKGKLRHAVRPVFHANRVVVCLQRLHVAQTVARQISQRIFQPVGAEARTVVVRDRIAVIVSDCVHIDPVRFQQTAKLRRAAND